MEEFKLEILRAKITISVLLILFFCIFGVTSIVFFTIYTQKTLVEEHLRESDTSETEYAKGEKSQKVEESQKGEETQKEKETQEVEKKEDSKEIVETDLFLGDLKKWRVYDAKYAKKEEEKVEKKLDNVDDEISDRKYDEGSFQGLNIKADSVLVWDIKKGEAIFKKDPSKPLPLASLSKLMTAVVALEEADPDLTVLIDNRSLMQYGNSGLFIGEEWKLDELAKISVMSSLNDASYAMASAVGSRLSGFSGERAVNTFVLKMNEKAKELGLSNTFFNNPTGLDINERTAGAYGSAMDIVDLTLYALSEYPGLLYSTRDLSRERVSLSKYNHIFENSNPIVSDIDGIVASKTGYTELAGGNLMVVVDTDLNYPVIIVVLGSTFNGRFEDVKLLTEETRNYLSSL